jgi:hypothetical protein
MIRVERTYVRSESERRGPTVRRAISRRAYAAKERAREKKVEGREPTSIVAPLQWPSSTTWRSLSKLQRLVDRPDCTLDDLLAGGDHGFGLLAAQPRPRSNDDARPSVGS